MSGNKVQDRPKTEQQRANDFIKEYEELCEKHGFSLVINPAFKARDDGTWSIVLQPNVGKLPVLPENSQINTGKLPVLL